VGGLAARPLPEDRLSSAIDGIGRNCLSPGIAWPTGGALVESPRSVSEFIHLLRIWDCCSCRHRYSPALGQSYIFSYFSDLEKSFIKDDQGLSDLACWSWGSAAQRGGDREHTAGELRSSSRKAVC
jgi:hypothetical protein